MTPIRLMPNGTIEADSPSEFAAVYKIAMAVTSNTPQLESKSSLSSVEQFVADFPAMWIRWKSTVHAVIIHLASKSNHATDQELKAILGYTAPGNFQLAGTLQAIGKVTAYSDVLIRTPAGSAERKAGAKYRYALTAQAKRAVIEHGLM
ncbi:MAG: hypothetical protein IIC92_04150 [Chloroflexi bacterium]|nr:hypothetical protein [Chloroflexota bacterium]